MSLLTKIFGDPNEKVLRSMRPLVEKTNSLEPNYANLSPDELKGASLALRARLEHGETLDDILPEAFAVCREAAKRTLGQRHYDVQLMGGISLHRGQIAEMRTGEGKTLTATLAVYLNGLTGRGVHVVTVNDYLARRDMAWMGQVYDALGLTVGCINHMTAFRYDASWKAPKPEVTGEDLAAAAAKDEGGETDRKRDETGSFLIQADYLRPVERREAYECDITYGTNNEFGFDYLRDNMVMRAEARVQRPLYYAIVDEVDSILIDEARTPLIISAPAEQSAEKYYRFARIAWNEMRRDEDYNVDEKMRAVSMTAEGISKVERSLNIDNLYSGGNTEDAFHIESALKAKEFYKCDRDYVVKDGDVVIVDEFTGRLMHGRRYGEGLHQAIEAQEHEILGHGEVEIQRESQTLATITFQNLFRMYQKLAGMTGTAATEAEEFSKIYKLDVTVLPPNKPSRRADLPDRVYKSEEAKFLATVKEIKERNEKGQPVLVGTISIEKNEILGELLRREGIKHELLNAKNHEHEAQTIAQAGRLGAVTVATNMAGRGVDVILGGNPPDPEAAAKVKELGGLMVIGTERHESRRIDNQLRGRSGRQGDPGTTQFFVSMEDDLMRIFGSDRMKGLMDRLGLPDDVPIENKMVTKSIASAQQKVEGHHFDIRKHLLEYDDVLNKHRETIYRKRLEVLELGLAEADKIRERAIEAIEQEVEQVVMFHCAAEDEKTWNIKEVLEVAMTILPVPPTAVADLANIQRTAGATKAEDARARTEIIEYLMRAACEHYDRLGVHIDKETNQPGYFGQAVKNLMLRTIDSFWIDHLQQMDHLRTGIGLQGYGQRDPLIEYKRQAYRMYHELVAAINKQIAYTVLKLGLAKREEPSKSLIDRAGVQLSAPSKESGGGSSSGPAKGEEKVGRNDPCPCGSGKKYKKCHGQ
jgi:preprotein translocase subunit SecA